MKKKIKSSLTQGPDKLGYLVGPPLPEAATKYTHSFAPLIHNY